MQSTNVSENEYSIEIVDKNSEQAYCLDYEGDCFECQVAALQKDKNWDKSFCIYSYNLLLTKNDHEFLDRNHTIYNSKARFYKCLICDCVISNFEEMYFHVTKTGSNDIIYKIVK